MTQQSNNIRFIHLRRPVYDFGRTSLYSYNVSATGGLTIAYEKQTNGAYRFAVARCNPSDHYCKRSGAALSRELLEIGEETWTMHVAEESVFYQQLIELLQLRGEFRRNIAPVVKGKYNRG